MPFVLLIILLSFYVHVSSEVRQCYRCRNAQAFSRNLTTSLLPLNPDKPCVLEPIKCAIGEHSCVYGLVSVVVSNGFWFHLSGCYVEPVNGTHCYRGVGPVQWPGYTAELRTNYCLCADVQGGGGGDLCNDSKFAKTFQVSNFNGKNGRDPYPLPVDIRTSSYNPELSATADLVSDESSTGSADNNAITVRLNWITFITTAVLFWTWNNRGL